MGSLHNSIKKETTKKNPQRNSQHSTIFLHDPYPSLFCCFFFFWYYYFFPRILITVIIMYRHLKNIHLSMLTPTHILYYYSKEGRTSKNIHRKQTNRQKKWFFIRMLFYGNEQIYGIDKNKSWTIKSLLGNFYVIFVCVVLFGVLRCVVSKYKYMIMNWSYFMGLLLSLSHFLLLLLYFIIG